MPRPELVTCGILKPEVMLRQAQAEIAELKDRAAKLTAAVDFQTAVIATLCARAGGKLLITDEELSVPKQIGQQRDDKRKLWVLFGRVMQEGHA